MKALRVLAALGTAVVVLLGGAWAGGAFAGGRRPASSSVPVRYPGSRNVVPVGEGLAKGAFRPVVGAVCPFSRAADAHRCLQEARNIGKVVLVPD